MIGCGPPWQIKIVKNKMYKVPCFFDALDICEVWANICNRKTLFAFDLSIVSQLFCIHGWLKRQTEGSRCWPWSSLVTPHPLHTRIHSYKNSGREIGNHGWVWKGTPQNRIVNHHESFSFSLKFIILGIYHIFRHTCVNIMQAVLSVFLSLLLIAGENSQHRDARLCVVRAWWAQVCHARLFIADQRPGRRMY